jgi:hypothetical protein
VVIGLIIGLRITADQQRPEQTGGRRCETIRTGENDNSREKMQNVRGDSSVPYRKRASWTEWTDKSKTGYWNAAA